MSDSIDTASASAGAVLVDGYAVVATVMTRLSKDGDTLRHMAIGTAEDPIVHLGAAVTRSQRDAIQQLAKKRYTTVSQLVRQTMLDLVEEEKREAGRERSSS